MTSQNRSKKHFVALSKDEITCGAKKSYEKKKSRRTVNQRFKKFSARWLPKRKGLRTKVRKKEITSRVLEDERAEAKGKRTKNKKKKTRNGIFSRKWKKYFSCSKGERDYSCRPEETIENQVVEDCGNHENKFKRRITENEGSIGNTVVKKQKKVLDACSNDENKYKRSILESEGSLGNEDAKKRKKTHTKAKNRKTAENDQTKESTETSNQRAQINPVFEQGIEKLNKDPLTQADATQSDPLSQPVSGAVDDGENDDQEQYSRDNILKITINQSGGTINFEGTTITHLNFNRFDTNIAHDEAAEADGTISSEEEVLQASSDSHGEEAEEIFNLNQDVHFAKPQINQQSGSTAKSFSSPMSDDLDLRNEGITMDLTGKRVEYTKKFEQSENSPLNNF